MNSWTRILSIRGKFKNYFMKLEFRSKIFRFWNYRFRSNFQNSDFFGMESKIVFHLWQKKKKIKIFPNVLIPIWSFQFPPLCVLYMLYCRIDKSQDTSYFKFDDSCIEQAQVRQQGDFDSLHRDLVFAFGSWEFDPMDVNNPFKEGEGSVHLWQGEEDRLVPFTLQRYIASKLPWIQYHELPGMGHMFPYADGVADSIIQELLAAGKTEHW